MEITAQLKDVVVWEDVSDIRTFVPDDPNHFGVSIQFLIGTPPAESAGDSFDVIACTPSWLAANVRTPFWERFRNRTPDEVPDNIAFGTGLWIMKQWSSEDILSAIHVICADASPGPDWLVIANQIGRSAPWEYDYRFDAFVSTLLGSDEAKRP